MLIANNGFSAALFALPFLWLATRLAKAIYPSAIVIKVIDGDTVKLKRWPLLQAKNHRIDGIDSPEHSQSGGKEAKAALESILPIGSQVIFEKTGKDSRYQRYISRIFSEDGIDVSLWMVEQGHAHFYEKYSEREDLRLAEINARTKRRGLWREERVVKPGDYRKSRR